MTSYQTGDTRRIGLDYLRGFVIVMVVLHHSVLAYCRFGHFDRQHYLWSTAPIVDNQRWVGFDIVVLFNDSYFMPLMFLLSGLFIRPSLARKGARAFLLDRLRRLGLPFVVAVLTIMPLAYYPSYRMTGSAIGFGAFWMRTIFDGPWPSGPAWFVAVLFGLDVVAVVLPPILPRSHAALSFRLLAGISLLVYLPSLIAFGPTYWFAWGPFTVQASRVLLYAAYFFVGAAFGPTIRIESRWPMLQASVLFALLLAVQIGRLRLLISPVVGLCCHGVVFALFCAAATRAFLKLFSRFPRRFPVWDSLSKNAYGIYLGHYLFVVWAQYALLDTRIGAIAKAAGVFSGALGLSWACSAVMNRVLGPSSVHGGGSTAA